MSGYIGSKAVNLSTTGADINGNANVDGTLDVTGAFTSLGIDDNAAATAVTIDASGNVGIGTATPAVPLDVNGRIRTDGGTNFLDIYHNNTIAYLETTGGAATPLGFATNGTERMHIDVSGNVFVGKTAGAFNTVGVELLPTGRVYATASGVSAIYANRKGSDGSVMDIANDGTTVGTIAVSGSTTAYNTSSDYRLKENITPIQGAGDIIKAMQPVTYNFKANKSEWQDGFLAHELQMLHPHAVTGEKDKMKDEEYDIEPAEEAVLDADGKAIKPAKEAKKGIRSVPDVQMVDYSKLTPILTAALQEALNKIEVLEAQNAAFETRLAALEATP